MIKIKVLFGNTFCNSTWQDKSFKTEIDAVEWCRRNYTKIWCINDCYTRGQLLHHVDIYMMVVTGGKECR